MAESDWHKRVREKTVEEYKKKGFQVIDSHRGVSRPGLFVERANRENYLSDADIIVINPKNGKVEKIIEIESSLNPKKIIGIIVATHLSNHLKAKEIIANLESVNMEIIYKEPKNLSSKKQQLALIETSLDKIMEKVPGCLSGFKFTGNA